MLDKEGSYLSYSRIISYYHCTNTGKTRTPF